MTIRPVRPDEALAWERMRYALWPGEDETHGEVTTAFFTATALQDPLAVLFAEDAGKPVGFAELSIRTDLPRLAGVRVGYVEGLYVEPVARGGKVARYLLAASRQWAREQRCTAFASDRADRVIVDTSFRPHR